VVDETYVKIRRQDYRGVRLRIGPMLGLMRFRTADSTIAGIECCGGLARVNSLSTDCTSDITCAHPLEGTVSSAIEEVLFGVLRSPSINCART
jgi:hypothetical protein